LWGSAEISSTAAAVVVVVVVVVAAAAVACMITRNNRLCGLVDMSSWLQIQRSQVRFLSYLIF
jgi:hypothetical protein